MPKYACNMLMTDLKRAFLSWQFVLAVALSVLITFLGRSPKLYADVVSFSDNSEGFLDLTPVIAAIPYTAAFADDVTNKVQNIYLVRCGVRLYTLSKAIAIVLSSFICVFLGKMLSALISSIWLPWAIDSSVQAYASRYMGYLLTQGHPVLFLMCARLCESMVCTLEAMAAAYISLYTLSKWITWSSPIVFHYVLTYGLWYLGVPSSVSITRIIQGRLYFGPLWDNVILFGIIGGSTIILMVLYVQRARKWLHNA